MASLGYFVFVLHSHWVGRLWHFRVRLESWTSGGAFQRFAMCVVAMLLCVFSCCFGLLVYNPKELDRVFRVYRVGF
jgi:hypothetical protein